MRKMWNGGEEEENKENVERRGRRGKEGDEEDSCWANSHRLTTVDGRRAIVIVRCWLSEGGDGEKQRLEQGPQAGDVQNNLHLNGDGGEGAEQRPP